VFNNIEEGFILRIIKLLKVMMLEAGSQGTIKIIDNSAYLKFVITNENEQKQHLLETQKILTTNLNYAL